MDRAPDAANLLQYTRRDLHALPGGIGSLLTVREVAERLSVSTATVYGLAKRGALPYVRISGAVRVAPADLEAFIAAGRTGGRR